MNNEFEPGHHNQNNALAEHTHASQRTDNMYFERAEAEILYEKICNTFQNHQ